MKIAIIHNQYKQAGGMESYLFSLIKGFTAAGDQVHVFVFKQDETIAKAPQCHIHKKTISPIFPAKLRKYLFLHDHNRHFNRDKYDISLSLTQTYAAQFAICGGVHAGYIQSMAPRKIFQRLFDTIEIAFEKRTYQRVPGIIAHSKLMAEEIKQYYQVNPEKIHLLYPPIDTDKFKSTRSRFSDAHGRKKIFLFPSTGHQRKGLAPLLAAFARLPANQYELWIAGKSLPQQESANVKFLGFIQDMENLYAAADFTILPSYYEPFGLVVVESLQCGTPVMVTQQTGAAEFITEQDGVVLQDNHPETIVAAILQHAHREFSVTPHFAERHGFTIENHIAQIKALAKRKYPVSA